MSGREAVLGRDPALVSVRCERCGWRGTTHEAAGDALAKTPAAPSLACRCPACRGLVLLEAGAARGGEA